ncbi:MAG: VWA domain-containing protein [Acidobacteriota bacterium]|nr:VWA domain-containing protein [Acidobacteriota bacterium]
MHDARIHYLVGWLILCLNGSVLGWAQQDQKGALEQEAIKLTATEVVVDVIVTDKKNKTIVDLTPADFEVYEDGIKQTITSVRLERRGRDASVRMTGEKPSTANPVAPATGSVARQPNLVILVFDNLSLARGSQIHAARAAREYLEKIGPDDWIAVFGIDLRLFMIQQFTRDREALKKAVEIAASSTSRQFTSSAEALERLLQTRGEGQPVSQQLAEAAATRLSPTGDVSRQLDSVLINTFRSFELFEREAQARASVLALLALIRGQQSLPGRKTVILFSEGFSIPSSVAGQFRSVIGNANRYNVAFYTVDAGGLRVESEGGRVSDQVSALATARAAGADPTIVEGGESMLGRVETIGRLNTQSVLVELAEATGGLAIRNTNDLRAGLARIDEDTHTYYVLTYAPSNQDFDGRFRKISLKVNRDDVRVRARSGYFALPSSDAMPVLPHEEPLFEALRVTPRPADFPLKVASLQFPLPPPRMTNSVQVVAEIPADRIVLTEDKPASKEKKKDGGKDEPKNYVGQLAVMALVKDARRAVVRKLSQNYAVSVRADRLDAFKSNKILFYRNTDLEPGQYQIELIARDAGSGKASVQQVSLNVPAGSAAPLRLSSIVPVGNVETLRPGERNEGNPFQYGNVTIMPNMDRVYKKSSDQKMLFYFMVQADPTATVNVKIEFIHKYQVVGQSSGALPAPDARGQIQYVAEFPTASFPTGAYDLRVTVTDGTHRVVERTSFTVVD